MKKIDKLYDNRVVIKPWGYEYVVYRNSNNLSVTLLKINYNKKTSLHCHPQKKSGFILLSGKAKFQLGLRAKNSEIHASPSKRMMARGLFLSIKSISKEGLSALEFETPVDKNDLVRLNTIVYTTLEIVRRVSFLLYPIIPDSSLKAMILAARRKSVV